MLVFEKYDAEHQKLWDTMKVIRDASVLHNMATKVKQYQAVYEKIQRETGVPWQMVAVIHIREAGLGDVGKFTRCLHNGQPWNKKTTIVPKNLGPWSSFHEAAVHALKLKKFNTIKTWTPAKMLSALEPYNGYGYRNKGIRSPYLWASTNHQQKGKYVADHVFDPNVMDTQMGCAAMLKYLLPSSTTIGAPEIPIIAGTATAAWALQDYILPITLLGGLLVAACIAYRIFRKRKNQK